jgi:alkylation response protein AidB-like acyl-CoA dehydrogenase
MLVTRSNPELPKHKGMTYFAVDMRSPGVDVRPLRQITGEAEFNEVFFTDVRVSAANRLGDEGQAWEIVTHALAYERVGVPRYHTGLEALDLAVAQLQAEGRWDDDPIARSRAGMIAAKFEAARMMTYLVVDQRVKRQPPSADANLSRVVSLEAVSDMLDFIAEYVPDCLTGGNKLLEDYYRINIPAGITGGTNEIQLDLVAQNGLGLPKA